MSSILKNTAGQIVKAQLIAKADGENVTSGTTTVYVTAGSGSQAAGGGTTTHEGNGTWSYQPTQAETNHDAVTFTFVHSSGVSVARDLFPIDLAAYKATGFSTLDASGVRAAIGLASANLDSQLADIPTVAEFEARTLPAASYFDPAADTVANVTLVATCTTNTDMRGTDGANTTAPLSAAGVRAAVGLASANLDNQLADIPTVAEFEARTLPVADYFDPATDGVIVTTSNDKTGYGLSSGAISAIEAALINEGDGQTLIDAIVQAIEAADIENDVLPALIRDAILDRVLSGNHDTAGTVGKALQDAAVATGLDAAGVRSAVGLASANLDTQLADIPTVAEFEARTLPAASYFDPAADTVANVTLVGTCTTNTDMRGTDGANTTAPLSAAGVRSAIGLASANLDTQLADIPTVAEFEARTLPVADYFDPATDPVANVTLVATCTTNTDMRGTDGANTTAPLSAAGVRSAVGLASANLDTQLASLPTADENAAALLDLADGVETDETLRQSMRLIRAACVGISSGMDTGSPVFRDRANSKNRIAATCDEYGNRSAVTTDAS